MTTTTTTYAAPQIQARVETGPVSGYLPRSKFLPVPFLLPVIIATTSFMAGGTRGLNDLAMLILAFLCAAGLVNELIQFSRRFGLGAFVLFGGVLAWFVHDYFKKWYGMDIRDQSATINNLVIAKNVMLHSVFVLAGTIGLLLPFGRWIERPFYLIPNPTWPGLYLVIAIILSGIGVLPYFLWAVDPWYEAMWMDVVGQRFHGARWNLRGPGGNFNLMFSWGAYIALMMKAGKFGGQLAAVYAILGARSPFTKIVCWLIWIFWLLLSFGSNTRGQVFVMILPPIAILFIKYHAQAAMLTRRFSKRAYLWSIVFGLLFLWMIQVQIAVRGTTLLKGDYKTFELTNISGNHMFSSSLSGVAKIPETRTYFRDKIVGERYIRPIPQAAIDFFIGPIPRAIWHSKPMDPAIIWFNEISFGTGWGAQGANATPGIVGWWYVRYGLPGVIQGGMLFGLVLIVSERILQRSGGRTITMLLALALAAWCFRSFRQWFYPDLYPILIAASGLGIMVKFANMMNTRRA